MWDTLKLVGFLGDVRPNIYLMPENECKEHNRANFPVLVFSEMSITPSVSVLFKCMKMASKVRFQETSYPSEDRFLSFRNDLLRFSRKSKITGFPLSFWKIVFFQWWVSLLLCCCAH